MSQRKKLKAVSSNASPVAAEAARAGGSERGFGRGAVGIFNIEQRDLARIGTLFAK